MQLVVFALVQSTSHSLGVLRMAKFQLEEGSVEQEILT